MRNTQYKEMKYPEQELMHDRFCTGICDSNLRVELLHHFKEDGKTAWTFEEQLAKAKAWEAAHATNLTIQESKTEEKVNYRIRHDHPQ